MEGTSWRGRLRDGRLLTSMLGILSDLIYTCMTQCCADHCLLLIPVLLSDIRHNDIPPSEGSAFLLPNNV
eukprot:7366289-Karenia_brevis.AAC.1